MTVLSPEVKVTLFNDILSAVFSNQFFHLKGKRLRAKTQK